MLRFGCEEHIRNMPKILETIRPTRTSGFLSLRVEPRPATPGVCCPGRARRLHTLSWLLVGTSHCFVLCPTPLSWQMSNLEEFSDHIQQSFLQRVRINKNTSPQGHRGSPACQATLEAGAAGREASESVRREVAGPAPVQVPARDRTGTR